MSRSQVFLGQKYGYRPIPAEILASEFEMIRDVTKKNPKELEMLDLWFKKDENFDPAWYILQPISTIYTNFTNKVSISCSQSARSIPTLPTK